MKLYFLKISCLLLLTVLMGACGNGKNLKDQYRVGIVNPSRGLDGVVEGFKEAMAGRGYKEGVNITYIHDETLQGLKEVETQVREMIADNVDLIYTLTTPATRRAKEATASHNIPVLFAPVFSPDTSGIVASLSAPGGNVTGIRVRGSTAKALEYFMAVLPETKIIFVPFHYTDDAACMTVEDLREESGKVAVEIVTERVNSQEDIDALLADLPEDIDAVWLTCSHLLFSNAENIVAAATAKGIPVASSTHQRDTGVIISYGEDNYRLGAQSSRMASSLLHGADPAHIPVETAEFYLGVNLKKARELGITVPDNIIKISQHVIY